MITKYILVSILILFLMVSCVGAADKTVSLKSSGLSETTKTSVNISNDGVTYTVKDSGISIKTATKIDGVLLSETPVTNAKGEVTVTSKDDTVSSKYTYFNNGTIKETITLLEDKELSFPITVPKGYRLIPWYNGQFKIVEESMEDTMTGLVAEKPYGIDNAGRYVEMNYTLKDNVLTLNYDKQIYKLNVTRSIKGDNYYITKEYDVFNIQYPLVIDPTWSSYGDHFINQTGLLYIELFSQIGTKNFTVPDKVTSIEYLLIAGGAGGGSSTTGFSSGGAGGGAGGLIYCLTFNVINNTNYTIVVGAGSAGAIGGATSLPSANGSNSSIFNATYSMIAIGGGGCIGETSSTPFTGGSGCGARVSGQNPGSGTSGQGNRGGYIISNSDPTKSGGGGANSVGSNSTTDNPDTSNTGTYYTSNITTENVLYAGGAGGGNSTFGGFSAANYGTGGWGAAGYGNNGGFGYQGVVVIRYQLPPVTNFTANVTSVDVNKPILFTDSSTNSPTSWQWTFGDGNTSTQRNPVKIYYGSGTYTVSLTATNAGGSNTSTRTNYITVTSGIPYAEFSANITTGVSPLNVAFTDTTNSSATSWNWTFGDGVGGGSNYSNSQNPTHVFTGAGYYNVTLNASSSTGFNITSKYHYINVSAALVNPTAYVNITPYQYKLYVLTNGTVQLNARNITGKFIYANVTFNKSEVNIMSSTNNFSVIPGLSVSSTYNNVSGYVLMNISNSSGGNVIIGSTLLPIVDMTFRGMSYTNGSAPLNFASSTVMLTTGGIETVNTKVPGILTTADSYFTFNVKLYNTATNTIINTVATINAAGSNVTPTTAQTSTGSYAFKANFSNVTFNVSCDGFYTLNQTVLIQSENDVILRLTPLSGPGQNTWYSPHQVRFTTISQEYGTILVGSTINVTPITSSFPQGGSADYLVNVYGINPAAANDMMNGTLIMSGVTGNDGGVTFTMLSSIGYNVNIKNDTLGINHNIKIYPIENDYNILINMITTDTTMQDMNDTILTYTVPNASYGTFGLTYKDTSGLTTNVNFSVWCIDNNTMMYSTDLIGMGTNTVYANYTIPVVNGAQYIWKYNATRSI